MKIAALQMDIVWESPEQNLEKAQGLIEEAVTQGARLVILPEMFPTGFSMRAGELAEPAGGPVERFLSSRARANGIYLLGTKAEKHAGAPQNVALLFRPDGGLILRYAKVHPFSFAQEHRHFSPGGDLPVARVDEFTVAVSICYDLRFPELFRALCFRGAELFLVPANWPQERVSHWTHLLKSRAIENQGYVVGVNRVGTGGGLSYNGCSAVIDPMGDPLAEGQDTEQVITADLDRDVLLAVRKELPFLNDPRKDLFPSLWPGKFLP